MEAITGHAMFLGLFAAWAVLSYIRLRIHYRDKEKRRAEEKKRNFYNEVTW